MVEVQGPDVVDVEALPGAFELEARKLFQTCSKQFQGICLQHGNGSCGDMIEIYEELLVSKWSCHCCSRDFSSFFRVDIEEPKCVFDADFKIRDDSGYVTRKLNLRCEFEIVQYQIAAIRYLNSGGTWQKPQSNCVYNFINQFVPLHKIPSVVERVRERSREFSYQFANIVSTMVSSVHTTILYCLSGHPKIFTLISVLLPVISVFVYRWMSKKDSPKAGFEDTINNLETQMMDDNACSLAKSLVTSSVLRFETAAGVDLGMGLAIGGELVITNHHIYEAMLIKSKLEPME